MVSLMVSLLSQISIKAANALETTVGLSSLSMLVQPSIRSDALHEMSRHDRRALQHKKLQSFAHTDPGLLESFQGGTVASTNSRTCM